MSNYNVIQKVMEFTTVTLSYEEEATLSKEEKEELIYTLAEEQRWNTIELDAWIEEAVQ